MELRILGTRVRVHPLALLMPPLAALMGLGVEAAALVISLSLHEAAHLGAARMARVRVEQLRLMPFGGAAQLGNLYALSPWRVFAVAAAGPAANLALLFVAAALAQWGALSPMSAVALARVNLALLLFNLLPALPLDGGRMLYALAAPRLGRARAVWLGLLFGRALAAVLALGALYGLASTGRLNLSMLFSAVFIAASAPDERAALSDARVASLLNALRQNGAPVPMRLCAVGSGCGVRTALGEARADAATLYAVYEGDSLAAFADDRQLLEAALACPAAVVGDAVRGRERRRTA